MSNTTERNNNASAIASLRCSDSSTNAVGSLEDEARHNNQRDANTMMRIPETIQVSSTCMTRKKKKKKEKNNISRDGKEKRDGIIEDIALLLANTATFDHNTA